VVGGTTWFFADPRNNQRFDYLFVDEAGQGLVFHGPNDFNLPETGIRFIPCLHDACSQSSMEEADLIRQLIPWLEKQSYRTKAGDIQPVTLDDILIVAPYNMQVNQLQKELPPPVPGSAPWTNSRDRKPRLSLFP
jgi:hypothetical protein